MKILEEFIAYYTQYAEFCNKVGDTEESETVKNLLGLFEELKELRKQERDRCSDCAGCVQWKCDCSNVRQQAIDDFEEKLLYQIGDLDVRDIIMETAVELKVGGEIDG